jgi:GT2 family glycosyltransferase/glycosyltransferase involved in cell wall biosynthesis
MFFKNLFSLTGLTGRQGKSSIPDAGEAKFLEAVEILAPHFDAEFYLRRNVDIVRSSIDPLEHYIKFGWREGRNPSKLFWTSYYCKENEGINFEEINPFVHYLTLGATEGRKPNPIGTKLLARPTAPGDAEWDGLRPRAQVKQAEVVVIIPVYRGYADTLAAILSVLKEPQAHNFALLVINDASPDEDLTGALRRLSAKGLFNYHENSTNLGFVKTANKGISLAGDTDVILLNSDAVVYGNWIDRFLRHARSDDAIASITPYSNNATICSYPVANDDNLIELEVPPQTIDQYASVCNEGVSTRIPTGIGFCFYMSRFVINEIGAFDEDLFSRGYGEENDWCMRALKAGYRNILANDVFVYHTGEVSFSGTSTEYRNERMSELIGKHPDYGLRISNYNSSDSGRFARMRLDLYRLSRAPAEKPVVFISHHKGGGIETHLAQLIKELSQQSIPTLVLRIKGPNALLVEPHFGENIFVPSVEVVDIQKNDEEIRDFLVWLSPRAVHVHSMVGLSWAATRNLIHLLIEAKLPLLVTVHDFSPICHRVHMVTSQGAFCGQPDIRVCEYCAKTERQDLEYVDPFERRLLMEELFAAARRVFTPSHDTALRLKEAFSEIDFEVVPHDPAFPLAKPRLKLPTPIRPLRVAIVGAVSIEKGADLLQSMAVDTQSRVLPIKFSVVGYSYARRLDDSGIVETGPYENEEEAFYVLRSLEPHIVFFPGLWPETFSYTLSIALAAGIPPVAFDIGSIAERLRIANIGAILDYRLSNDPGAVNDALLALPIRELWEKEFDIEPSRSWHVLKRQYGLS